MNRLIEIQQRLKAPKGQFNSFGNYKYRSCEDIMEAVKPILQDLNLSLVINDELQNIGERYYIKATVSLYDKDGHKIVSTSAFAREEETKKGMDGSQITGASSSYARKYALNGLFAIDDTKDSDFTNKHGKEEKITETNNKLDEQIAKESEKLVCSDCGKTIFKPAYEFSMSKYGKPLCRECLQHNKKLA